MDHKKKIFFLKKKRKIKKGFKLKFETISEINKL